MGCPQGKTAQNVVAVIDTLLQDIDKEKILEIKLTGYQQLGEYMGEIVLPTIEIRLKEK